MTLHLSGKYTLIVTNAVLHSMRQGDRMYVNWHSDVKGMKNNDARYFLNPQLVAFVRNIINRIESREFDKGYHLEGYTHLLMEIKLCFMHILLFKVENGMTGFMFTLRKLMHLERQLKITILPGF